MFLEEEDLNSKETKVVMAIMRLSHIMRRHMDSLAEMNHLPEVKKGRGLSGTNLFILAYLYRNREKDVFQKDLEECFNLRGATISKVLQIMEKKELIRREQVEHDGRLKKIVLTDQTLEGMKQWKKDSRNLESQLTRGFGEEELEQFYRLLIKAIGNFE